MMRRRGGVSSFGDETGRLTGGWALPVVRLGLSGDRFETIGARFELAAGPSEDC